MKLLLSFCAVTFAVSLAHAQPPSAPLVIAHRGASGYLPEHTLEAAAFAYAQGADFIEQDLVTSRDDVLVVCHDITLETKTDVARVFPERKRPDGRYYAVDFSWAELRTLRVRERIEPIAGRAVYPARFPDNGASFRLHTMEEAILLVQGLNRSTGRNVGVYPELKAPAWHAREGKDPGRALLALLARHGYTDAAHAAFVQCFEPAELRRLRFELKTPLKLVQLLGTREEDGIDYPAMLTPEGLRKIASYAQGIGPHLSQVVDTDGAASRPRVNPLVADAHALGLVVHPYTFRRDDLPPGVANIEALLAFFVRQARVDGLFIDQPDAAVNFLCR